MDGRNCNGGGHGEGRGYRGEITVQGWGVKGGGQAEAAAMALVGARA